MFLQQHFGWRGRQETYETQVGDLKFQTADDGTEYIVFYEGIVKTRQSGLTDKSRPVPPKVFATNTERCPIKIIRSYLARRPLELRKSGPLYLTPIHNPISNIWYKNVRMSIYLLIHETNEGKFSLGHLWEEAYQSLYEENTRKEAQTGKSSWLRDHKDYWSQ